MTPRCGRGRGGAGLDALIAEQRELVAQHWGAVAWTVRGQDESADLPAHALAAGFKPEEPETVATGPISSWR